MKNIKILMLLALLFIGSNSLNAQNIDTSMIVNGVCGMCERVIEKAAKVEGVKKAEWDSETKILVLSYDSSKVDLMRINKSIIASGYDTEYATAPDEAYNKLHGCCHYRDPEVVNDHEAEKQSKKQ